MDSILGNVEQYYSRKIREFGPTARGVDWRDEQGQDNRFRQLLRYVELDGCSILDYGCGYGALYKYLVSHNICCNYVGYDISDDMLSAARLAVENTSTCSFLHSLDNVKCDWVIASGVFNVKGVVDIASWEAYVMNEILKLSRLCNKGVSLNFLSSLCDNEFKQDHLFYCDFSFVETIVKRWGRKAQLIHDYSPYEFTLVLRSDG